MENTTSSEETLEKLTRGLNPEQAHAVRALNGPLVVVAGPGSGKTRVLTHRIAAIVATGAAWPSEILAVTFTNKAAGEMRERLGHLLGEDTVKPMWVSTFHSMCARLLRIEADAAGLPRAYSILDSGDVRTVLRDIHRELELPSDPKDVSQSASTISRIKNGGTARPDPITAKVMEAYRQRLVRLGALDFDDLLLRARDLLEEDPQVRERYQKRFRYVLVDEYQDTNPVQARLVELLAAGSRNICVVGDNDQSIYGFRSATPAVLQNFSQQWDDAQVVVLEENYRSTGAILEVCKAIIAPNPSKFRSGLRTSNGQGEPVRMFVCDDDREEARLVAGEMHSNLRNGSCAVLMRTNAQTRVLEDALLQEGVPYAIIGALRFYERAEIKDALAYLRLLTNPTDSLAFARVCASPRRGIGPKAIEQVETKANGGNLVQALRQALTDGSITRSRNGWEELLAALDTVSEAAVERGPREAVAAVLSSGLRDYVRLHSGENSADRLENLDELLNAAAEFSERRPLGSVDEDGVIVDGWNCTEAFLSQIALTSSADDEGGGGNAVQLLTAHASKGKEFDTVYVVGVEDNLFPHGRRGEASDVPEERRLLFVACSRGRTKLTLTRAVRRFVHGNLIENAASPFLDDLPASVQVRDLSQTRRGSVRASQRTRHHGSLSEHWGRPGGGAAGRRDSSLKPDRVAEPVKAPGPRLAAEDAVVGRMVHHAAFGKGHIVATSGNLGDERVTVKFVDGAQRQFMLAMAPLEAI